MMAGLLSTLSNKPLIMSQSQFLVTEQIDIDAIKALVDNS